AGSWGSKAFARGAAELHRLLLTRVNDEALPLEERVAAARGLVEQQPGDAANVALVLKLISPRTPPELAAGLLRAVEQSDAPDAGRLVLERLPELTLAARAAGLGVLLTRPEWTRALLAQADAGKVLLTE